eukprot:CAMPEP_0119165298 /NCGR_PEP_ID=MMETSP1315-20130426/4993_1 /TAXON_ID=676789 /ORGANISM="Prasinoderma singularis, Strain RCC927" /LENGTH=261 /DNA_ID=CAMNT_0007158559 /DNA_START=66 /DNA_END=851 /DNA_ORIENTATION=+
MLARGTAAFVAARAARCAARAASASAAAGRQYVDTGGYQGTGLGGFGAARDPLTFAQATFYRAAAAMSVELIPPSLEARQNAETGEKYLKVAREGVVLLTMAPSAEGDVSSGSGGGFGGYQSQGPSVTGTRRYDWATRKGYFALDLLEAGTLLARSDPALLAIRDSAQPLNFYHQTGGAGKELELPSKSLKVTLSNDSVHFSLATREPGGERAGSITITINDGEMAVIRELVRYAIPRMTGMHAAYEAKMASSIRNARGDP